MISLLPHEASSYAPSVDSIFTCLLLLCSGITLTVFAVMVGFCIRYRKGSSADRTHYPSEKMQIGIELTWIIIPFLIFLGLFLWAGNVYYHMFSPPKEGLAVYVIGKQWMWKMEHEGGQREINQLHVPIDQNVVLTMISQDVIHDFDVPAFRIKHDVLPGRYVRMWFKPTKLGTFHLFCGQYCGDLHSQMIGEVIVLSQTDYASWLRPQGPQSDLEALAVEGSRYFHTVGCSACHEGNPLVQSPSLVGWYGRSISLQSGEVVRANDDFFRDSILQPAKHVPVGYKAVMPSFQGLLSEEQMIALLAYIKSLSNNYPATPHDAKP